jgi:dCMP deaminase
MKQKFIDAHMKVAEVYAQLSSAKRLQVGAIVVKDDRVISIGYNGTPSGWDNNCEDILYTSPWTDELEGGVGVSYTYKTKPEVIHAERNALDKLAKFGGQGNRAAMFITHAPCLECAKSIFNTGISAVYYRSAYRETTGIEFLQKCGVSVEQVKD